MRLYPHNQKAYDSAVEALKHASRTCIIHPTGTGKSLIISEFINQNPTKKHLLLAPSRFIKDEIAKHTSIDFEFSTYVGVVVNGEDDAKYRYDFIYLDEFHRIGAELWGKYTLELLDNNPNAKVVGTTATHIRFLDDHRNMATEIFKDNIASSMSLNQAILSGILQKPTYIAALYSISAEYEKLATKIRNSDHQNKELIAEQLKRNVIDWEKSGGIDNILKKHLTKDRNRIIVFCKNRAHLDEAHKILLPTFLEIWNEVEVLKIFSDFSNSHNSGAMANFANDSHIAKILFTIDMANEGLHIKGVNTIILMRSTVSPIIFYQQIGRGFSVGQDKEPLIFDFVNNFSGVRFREFGRELTTNPGNTLIGTYGRTHSAIDLAVKFIDETKEIEDLFRSLANSLESWEISYQKAVKYFEAHGHLNAPQSTEVGNWIHFQRFNKSRNLLSQERIKKLENINIKWNPRESNFSENLISLKTFIEANGRLPRKSEDPMLFLWIANLKRRYKTGVLNSKQLNKLKNYINFEDQNELNWKKNYLKCKSFFEANGHLRIPKKGHELSTFVTNQRVIFNRGRLSKERFDKLTAIGFVTNLFGNDFELKLNELSEWLKINKNYPTKKNNLSLAKWITFQRMKKKRGELPVLQEEKLNSLGFIWQTELSKAREENKKAASQ